MSAIKNRKGFTLVELLAVIVVLAIVMSIAVVAITSVIDNSRKAAFVSDAKIFLDGAIQLVDADGLNNLLGSTDSAKYAPACSNGTGSTKFIPLSDIETRSGTGVRSPYGTDYKKGTKGNVVTGTSAPDESFVKVESKVDANLNCSYIYSIYLTDGVYCIGSKDIPLTKDKITNSSVVLESSKKTG